MKLQERIELMYELGIFLKSGDPEWQETKQKAFQKNPWFTPEFISHATDNIVQHFLQKELLEQWSAFYHLDDNIKPKNVGIVMAGNIPLVGFHDFLSAFIGGHRQTIKLSSKDDELLPFLLKKLISWKKEVSTLAVISELLKGCDAYIATGSNNLNSILKNFRISSGATVPPLLF